MKKSRNVFCFPPIYLQVAPVTIAYNAMHTFFLAQLHAVAWRGIGLGSGAAILNTQTRE